MEIRTVAVDICTQDVDVLIVNLFQGVKFPAGGTGAVDSAMQGVLSSLLKTDQFFTGKLGQSLLIPTFGKLASRYILVVGLGEAEKFNALHLRRVSATAVRECGKYQFKTAATLLHGAGFGGFNFADASRLLAEGSVLGAYQFLKRKSKVVSIDETAETASSSLKTLVVTTLDQENVPVIESNLKLGQKIATHVNLARDWVADSANYVTPDFLQAQAKSISNLTLNVFNKQQISEMGMGAFSLVAEGSEKEAYLIHLSYKPSLAPQKKIALVGKGITFDSGGLSLKPAGAMETMKMDMAGAAAVLATMKAISELEGDLPYQVDAFIPTCENMPSGCSSKPGDIATSLKGKTIEVNNTDAEGRLILCDALTYAQQTVQPDEIIDLATLTGACVVALGKTAAGIMGNYPELIQSLRAAGEKAGEKLWELPLYEEYKAFLKSDVADMINSGAKGEAGSSAGGMFLQEFIEKGVNWAHLDIAGPAWTTKDVPEAPKGATGFGVRTLLYYLYNIAQ